MNNDNFTEAARAEAQVRWPSYPSVGFSGADDRQHAFREGASWARAHLAAQEPTDAALPENVANLIRDLTDPGDCWFDHSGGCQEHGYLDLTPEQECPHSEAKRLLAARAARRGEEGAP